MNNLNFASCGNQKLGNKFIDKMTTLVSGVEKVLWQNPRTVIQYPHTTYGKGIVPPSIFSRAKINNIIGVSSKFNQLVQNGNFENSINNWIIASGSATVSNNVLTLTSAVGRNGIRHNRDSAIYANHKYLALLKISNNVTFQVSLLVNQGKYITIYASDTPRVVSEIFTNEINDILNFDIFPHASGVTGNATIQNVMLIDLTAMYGAGNEPSTTAQFLADHPEYNSYVPYNEGSVNSATITKVSSVGKNLFNLGVYPQTPTTSTTYVHDGILEKTPTGIKLTATTTSSFYSEARSAVKMYIGEGKSFNLSYKDKTSFATTVHCLYRFYDEDGNASPFNTFAWNVSSGSHSFSATVPSGYKYMAIRFGANASSVSVGDTYEAENIQIEIGSTATQFVPYQYHELPTPEPITLRSAGTAHDVYTPITGVIDRPIGMVKLKDLNWSANETSVSGKYRMIASLPDIVPVSVSSLIGNLICGKYTTVSASNTWYCIQGICVTTSAKIFVYDDAYSSSTSATDFKNHFTDDDWLYYEKSTPTTEQVTPINPFIQVESGGQISLTHTESPATASKFTMEYANKY